MNVTPRPPADHDGYTIIGGGAIGGTLGWHLARTGYRIVIVDSDAEHVRAIRDKGLTLVRNGVALAQPVDTAVTPGEFSGTMRHVLLAVKAHATQGAVQWLLPHLSPDGYVVSLQNGLNEDLIAQHIGEERTIGAFVDLFADVIEPGVISDGGAGALAIGELNGEISERIRVLAADLQAWGPAVTTTNVAGYLWSKLGFGAMLIATSLADAPMAHLLDHHRATAHALAAEIFAVADVQSIELEPFDAFIPQAYVPHSTADTNAATDRLVAWLQSQTKDRSGVWRDIAVRRRPTEVPTHYAPILKLADQNGIPVPLLRAMLQQIAEVEADPSSMSEARLDNLDKLVAASA